MNFDELFHLACIYLLISFVRLFVKKDLFTISIFKTIVHANYFSNYGKIFDSTLKIDIRRKLILSKHYGIYISYYMSTVLMYMAKFRKWYGIIRI